MESRGAARGGHGLTYTDILGNQSFKFRHLWPLDDPSRTQHLYDGAFFFLAKAWLRNGNVHFCRADTHGIPFKTQACSPTLRSWHNAILLSPANSRSASCPRTLRLPPGHQTAQSRLQWHARLKTEQPLGFAHISEPTWHRIDFALWTVRRGEIGPHDLQQSVG